MRTTGSQQAWVSECFASNPLATLNPKRISETGVTSLSVAAQTLGEEYTDIWQSTASGVGVSQRRRLALILLPILPTYVAARLNVRYPPGDSTLGKVRKSLPATLEIAGEVNLALFYLRGAYYDLVKRIFGIQYVRGLRRSPFMPWRLLNRGPHFDFSVHPLQKIQTVDHHHTLCWESYLPSDWLIVSFRGFVLEESPQILRKIYREKKAKQQQVQTRRRRHS